MRILAVELSQLGLVLLLISMVLVLKLLLHLSGKATPHVASYGYKVSLRHMRVLLLDIVDVRFVKSDKSRNWGFGSYRCYDCRRSSKIVVGLAML